MYFDLYFGIVLVKRILVIIVAVLTLPGFDWLKDTNYENETPVMLVVITKTRHVIYRIFPSCKKMKNFCIKFSIVF